MLFSRCQILALAGALALTAAPARVHAQAPDPDTQVRIDKAEKSRVPVTIAVVDEVPLRGASVMVVRRAALAPHDVIVINRDDAYGEQLSAAIFNLLGARALSGDTAHIDQTIRVTARRGPRAWRMREVPTLDRLLERIARTPEVSVAGIGPARTAEVYLPPGLLKGKLRPGT